MAQQNTQPRLPDGIREALRRYGEAQYLLGHSAAQSNIRAVLRIEVDTEAERNQSLADSGRATVALNECVAEIRGALEEAARPKGTSGWQQ